MIKRKAHQTYLYILRVSLSFFPPLSMWEKKKKKSVIVGFFKIDENWTQRLGFNGICSQY